MNDERHAEHAAVRRAGVADSHRREVTMATQETEQKPETEKQPAGATIKGETSDEFDGIALPTLRSWVKFWGDPERSTDEELEAINAKTDHADFTREQHVEVIQAEIDAREAKRSQGGPNA